MIETIKNIQRWTEIKRDLKKERKSIGFVPTMGALHQGHLSLVQKSISENDVTLISIFLNPTQFNNSSDLTHYPSSIKKDLLLLQKETLNSSNLNFVLLPDFEQIYPDNYNFKVSELSLSHQLCGAHRPGHFDGVLTVVLKLLNLSGADRAYFGEKDFQQYSLIQKMKEALFIDTEIIACPIVREDDGLAMSSRNRRLTEKERKLAPQIYKTLQSSSSAYEAKEQLSSLGFDVDYVEDIENRRFAAAQLGDIRLIDNVNI